MTVYFHLLPVLPQNCCHNTDISSITESHQMKNSGLGTFLELDLSQKQGEGQRERAKFSNYEQS